MFPQISNWVKIFTNFKHRVFCVVTSCKIRRRRLANFTSNLFPAHFSDFIWRRRRTKHLDMSLFCVSMRMISKYLIKLVTYFGICMWLLTSQVFRAEFLGPGCKMYIVHRLHLLLLHPLHLLLQQGHPSLHLNDLKISDQVCNLFCICMISCWSSSKTGKSLIKLFPAPINPTSFASW